MSEKIKYQSGSLGPDVRIDRGGDSFHLGEASLPEQKTWFSHHCAVNSWRMVPFLSSPHLFVISEDVVVLGHAGMDGIHPGSVAELRLR